ncbi:SAP10 Candidapepsin-10 [Candida maltosa Xu316]
MIFLLLLSLIVATVVECSLKIDFEVHKASFNPHLMKRSSPVLSIINNKSLYITSLAIGSNKDPISVSIDTGSADLWVMGSDVTCFDTSELHVDGAPSLPEIFDDINPDYSCTANGTFDTANSTTFKSTDDNFVIGYTDGSAAIGKWGIDSVQFGNSTINELRLGIASQSSVSDGILGIGIPDGYDNFPIQLKNQKLIDKVAYSVYLNSSDAIGGTVLFGAIDHAKYEGALTTVPLTSDTLLSVNVTYENVNYSVILDTGSTFSIFPDTWINDFGTLLNGTYDDNEEVYRIDCDSRDDFFEFEIGNASFAIPVEDFIVENDDVCYLAIMGNSVIGGDGILFGGDILRSIYLVYDLEDRTISVAPVRYTDDEDIEELGNQTVAVDNSTVSTSQTSVLPTSQTSALSSTSSVNQARVIGSFTIN